MIKIVILGYWVMLMVSYGTTWTSKEWFWPYFWCWDQMFGGGVLLWLIAFRYSKKYSIPAFLTFLFSSIRFSWNVYCYTHNINPADTWTTVWLAILLVPIIYHTIFVYGGRTPKFLNKYLIKMFKP